MLIDIKLHLITTQGGGVVSEPVVSVDASKVDGDLMPKDPLKSDPALMGSADDVNDRLEWYAVADEYWKEYLNDLARKAVIEKMVRMYSKWQVATHFKGSVFTTLPVAVQITTPI